MANGVLEITGVAVVTCSNFFFDGFASDTN